MNPFSGENPPFISSSRSQSWRPVRSHEGQSFDCAFNSDRKSTRLNSSHSQISYAVFCLKKKNTPLPPHHPPPPPPPPTPPPPPSPAAPPPPHLSTPSCLSHSLCALITSLLPPSSRTTTA